MIKGLAHVCIGALDLQETADFYCNILGMEKFFSLVKEDEEKGFYLKAGPSTFVEVFPENEQYSIIQKIRHLCLEVDNIDQLIADIREKGWDISEKSRASAGNWQCWANDPNGVKIEFQEYTEGCSQLTGEDCQVKW